VKEKLLKLLEVKSIISLITAFVFAYLSVKQILGAESVMAIIILVFKFFFDYQESKNKNNKGDKE
jgi:hypothetical protein